MDWTTIIVSFITAIGGTLLGWLLHRRELAAKVSKIESESEEAKAQATKAKAEAAEALATAENIEQKTNQALLETAAEWIERLETRVNSLERERSEQDERIRKQQKQIEYLTCDNEKLESSLASITEKVERLQQSDAEVRKENKTLRRRLAVLTKIVAKNVLNGDDYESCVQKLCDGIPNVTETDRAFLKDALEGANNIEL